MALVENSLPDRVFKMIAEFPGVKITSREIAEEFEITSHLAGSIAFGLHQRGYIKKESHGHGKKSSFWVEP